MTANIFRGQMVHLGADGPEVNTKAFMRWDQDSEYFRLFDSEPPILWSEKKIKELEEKYLEEIETSNFAFSIHKNEDDELLGFVALFDLQWSQGEPLVTIALGERDHWGKGYGTDAMRTMLREGRRWDWQMMGILREEWLTANHKESG